MKRKNQTIQEQIVDLMIQNGYGCPSVMAQDLFRLSMSLALAAGMPGKIIKKLINQELDVIIKVNKKPKKRKK